MSVRCAHKKGEIMKQSPMINKLHRMYKHHNTKYISLRKAAVILISSFIIYLIIDAMICTHYGVSILCN